MSNETLIDEADRDDTTDTTSTGLGKRIERIDRVMQRTHAAIDRINAVSGTPPDDNQPTLDSIKTEAQAIITAADAILRKMTT